jgi:putative AbiEi antitoxin of type IV toxin-antitoxin system
MSREAEVAMVAARQHALVTLEQARKCGFTDDAVRHRVRAGRWRRLRHGLYLVNGAPESWKQAVLAVVLASGPDAVASHLTAGVLWRLPNLQHEVTFQSARRDLDASGSPRCESIARCGSSRSNMVYAFASP